MADLKSSPRGWRDAVAVKNSSRERELSSLYPRSQQASATPSAGDLVPVGLSGFLYKCTLNKDMWEDPSKGAGG